MIRLRVLIYNEDYSELCKYSKRDKKSVAVHVRRAIHSYVKHMKYWEDTYAKDRPTKT